ncbi:MAG: glycosyltransferase family 4 protein [Pseudomonadota bacterium]
MFTSAHPSIVTLLPRGEGFSPQKAGAIALVVRDFVGHSKFQKQHTVFGSELNSAFPECDYQPIKLPPWPISSRSYRYFLGADSLFKQMAPQLIELHNRAIYVPWIKRAFPNAALSFQLHNDPQTIRGLQFAKQRQAFLQIVDVVYCVSEYLKTRFLEGVENHSNKVHVIPIGLDIDQIAPIMGERKPVILFVGRIIPEKGALLFAQAVRQVLSKVPTPWRVEMIGAQRFGQHDKKSDYERQVLSVLEPLGERVRYHGYLPFEQMLDKVEYAEIAVVPSQWHEPFGRTALEAMAGGAALVATPYGGLAEVIGDAALRVDSDKASDFAEAIERLIQNPGMRRTFQAKGLKRAEENFKIQDRVAELDRIRAQLFEKGP